MAFNNQFELQTISLNPGNDSSPNNNELVYVLPYPLKLTGYDCALASLFLFNSWPNITSAYGNNILRYNFPGAGANPYLVLFPNGNYSLDGIGEFLQFQMATNGHYLVDGNGNNVYFLSLVVNPTYYAITITATPIPTVLPAGWSNPNGISLSGQTPQLIIPTAPTGVDKYGMTQILGMIAGTYPPTAQSTEYQINSNGVGNAGIPQVSPVVSVNVNLNLVNSSHFNVDPATIYSFSSTAAYGAQIQIIPYTLIWLKASDAQFSQIRIYFTDQNGRPLGNLDPNIVANIYIRKLVQSGR